jgi:3-oxoacyl-[acyl-carrier protein] reductase
MDLHLNDKRALVTGSTSGLGRATARRLAAEGAAVVIHGRDERRAAAVADDISADGGPIDILVNNAGAYDALSWHESSAEVWARTYDVNVISGIRMIHGLAKGMVDRGWGRFIQIGGGLSIQPMAMQPHYNASLAARHNLAVSLARELAGTGVTSNVVSPGAILVEATQALVTELAPSHGWGETWDEIEKNATASWVPNDIGRFGRPEEIADTVAFVASPLAGYISGATIRVDGGLIRSVH